MQTKLYNVVISEKTKQLNSNVLCIIKLVIVYEVMPDGSQRLFKIISSSIRSQTDESDFTQRGAS